VTSQAAGQGVAVNTEISEGPKYNLGAVELVGADLPREAMLKAASFESGKVANWRDIRQKVYAMEPPVKRTGYFDAVARPERILHDDQHTLDLRVSFVLGPLYHFGTVTFVGLPPAAEETARKLWKMEPGSPYDYAYSTDFLREFSKKVDLRGYKLSLDTSKAPGQIVNDKLKFLPK
jgi:outer membrane protein assembly factor BamA